MNKKNLWLILLAGVLLCGCARAGKPAAPTPVPASAQTLRLAEPAETEKDGIRLRAETLEDGVLRIRISNRSGKLWYYGEGFGLFRRSAEGGWNSVPDERSWTMIAHELEDGDEVTLDCDLSPLPLEAGTYKLVRDGLELPFRVIGVLKNP